MWIDCSRWALPDHRSETQAAIVCGDDSSFCFPSLRGTTPFTAVRASWRTSFGRWKPRHDVAALYLRERGELPIDDDLQGSLRRVEEVPYPRHLTFATRLARRTAALRGIPSWASFVDVPEFAHRLREIMTTWHPEIVHFEYHVMGQYARGLPDHRAARILSEYEAGVLAAREHMATGSDGGALESSLQRRAWERFERRVIGDMDAVVVFSDRDKAALAPLAGETPIVRIGIGTHVPRFPLEPLGAAGHRRLLFIGNFMHPPNVDAAIRLTDRIFPAVRARVPGSVLRVVGAHPPAGAAGAST